MHGVLITIVLTVFQHLEYGRRPGIILAGGGPFLVYVP